jgi:hypothetical protein
MPKANQSHKRLSRSFHSTFKPERQYIHALLRFAAAQKSGTPQEIRDATGIPTGETSGKVPATLDYARGMGLITLAESQEAGVKKPMLTQFGRTVLLEDPYQKEAVTQWIAHFNLCNPWTGADVWFHTFFEGTSSLGMDFPRSKLEKYLALIYKTKSGGIIGPMVGMYEDTAAFLACGVLVEDSGIIRRKPAPVLEEYCLAYGAWLLQLMKVFFPDAKQVTVTEMNDKTGWRTIPGWNVSEVQSVLDQVERKGHIEVDRHMNPWILRPVVRVEEAWARIYGDLI